MSVPKRPKITKDLLERAIADDGTTTSMLVAILEATFRLRIVKALIRCGHRSLDEVDDISQETFVSLFENEGRLMHQWDPERASFETYSGLIAEQRALEYLRRKRDILLDENTPSEWVEPAVDSSQSPDRLVANKEVKEKTLARLWEELHESKTGRRIFSLLFVELRDVDEICTLMNMKESAVYAWRSRLARRIEELAIALEKGEEEEE